LPTEAIAAVDGAIATGAERNRSLIAALSANDRVHLARTSVKAEAVGGAVGTP